jgi:hypothetical protein
MSPPVLAFILLPTGQLLQLFGVPVSLYSDLRGGVIDLAKIVCTPASERPKCLTLPSWIIICVRYRNCRFGIDRGMIS